jgi:hypothetical protein
MVMLKPLLQSRAVPGRKLSNPIAWFGQYNVGDLDIREEGGRAEGKDTPNLLYHFEVFKRPRTPDNASWGPIPIFGFSWPKSQFWPIFGVRHDALAQIFDFWGKNHEVNCLIWLCGYAAPRMPPIFLLNSTQLERVWVIWHQTSLQKVAQIWGLTSDITYFQNLSLTAIIGGPVTCDQPLRRIRTIPFFGRIWLEIDLK